MSLESKIKELMEAKRAKQLNEAAAGKSNDGEGMNSNKQGDSQAPAYTEIDPYTGDPKVQDSSLKKGPAEPKQKQGDSKDADYQEVEANNANSNTPDTSLSKGNAEPQHKQGNSRDSQYSAGTGKANNGNYEAPTAPGNGVKAFEDTEIDGTTITEEDLDEAPVARKIEMNLEALRKDIASVFAGDENLSEEFKTQAGSIFEAAVIARVNNEVEAIAEELAAQNAADFEELKEGLVEKVDSYLNYVVEQWMSENEIAVEQGLRTEVAEDFMVGLKNLFQEHYFEVPSDRVDVLEDMATKVDEVTARLNESISASIELKEELDAIKRDRIIEHTCRDLTATDAEKLSKLLEGVEFDNDELFQEKVKVVKENYFPNAKSSSPERALEEQAQMGSGDQAAAVPAHMRSYVEALSRGVKAKKNLG